MISALKERLSHGAAGNVQADESAERARLQAGLDAMDARLRDKDREIQMLAGRAAAAATFPSHASRRRPAAGTL